MAAQSKLQSVAETITNTVVGFAINWSANMLVLPLFGWHATGAQAFHLGLIFTAISIARGYLLRRLYNLAQKDRTA